MTWDAKSRVKTVGTEAYSYDPMNYRIGRSGGTLGNRSYFLEGEHLESEYSGSQLQAKYFRGSSVDELVAAWMYDTDAKIKPFLFHHDQVTSTTAVSGHNGGITQSVKYAAFGAVQSSTGSSPNRLKYTGREDDGNGLMYYRARYYDPIIGRFISEDPLGFASGDISFYAYAGANPVNHSDPSGHCGPLTPLCVWLGEAALTARTAFTVVNAARTATTVTQAAAIGAGTSVAVGGAIRSATGQSVYDPSAISFDAALGGAFGVGGQAYNAFRIAGSSSVAKGAFASSLAERQLGSSVIGKEVSVAAGGARPRLDYLTQVGGDLLGVEVKFGNASLTSAQRIGYGAINAGESSNLFGSVARGIGVDGLGVSGVNILRFGALDGVPGFSSVLGGAAAGSFSSMGGGSFAGGGFLVYPNKVNSNMTESVYSK